LITLEYIAVISFIFAKRIKYSWGPFTII